MVVVGEHETILNARRIVLGLVDVDTGAEDAEQSHHARQALGHVVRIVYRDIELVVAASCQEVAQRIDCVLGFKRKLRQVRIEYAQFGACQAQQLLEAGDVFGARGEQMALGLEFR